MDQLEEDGFRYKMNTFLGAALLEGRARAFHKGDQHWVTSGSLNTLSSISALYIYTEPAPCGYGTPGPKVAESVLRALEYNRKPEDKTIVINGYRVNWAAWNDPELPYPFHETTGNYHPGQAHRMYRSFLKRNISCISHLANQVVQQHMAMNCDVLTKGRQTWCPLTRRSVPSSTAYQEMDSFFKLNLGKSAINCLEWIMCFFKCVELKKLKIVHHSEKTVTRIRYDKKHHQRIKRSKVIKVKRITEIDDDEEIKRYMFDLSREFCSYIKHGERAKLKRRAIASPNMIKRMMLKIIEQFHLDLGKKIEGSTISIGGEEKKRKIVTNLNSAEINSHVSVKVQATEDATKWNECLSAENFLMMHKTFFDPTVRQEMNLPPPTDNELLFLRICEASHWILANKTITMGEGPVAISKTTTNRLGWRADHMERMNSKTREWFERCIPILHENRALVASPGMLMGMHNAASTTLALAATMHLQDQHNVKVVTLRSSDDSMTVFVASDITKLIDAIEINRRSLKMLGVNLSPDKSFLFPEKYGEYTSWFQDNSFVAQYGVETSSLRPQGKNPADDFFSISKTCQVAQLHNTVNPLGAELWLRVGISNVRRLYRIKFNPWKREGISPNKLLLADGGLSPWDVSNCHLEEIAIKEREPCSTEERDYFKRVCNPENPFSGKPEEEIAYSKETGDLVLTVPENPRNAFTYMKRANRTIKNVQGKTFEAKEKASAEVMKILGMADASTQLRVPSSKHSIAHHIKSCLSQMAAECELTEEELESFNEAMAILEHGADRGEADPEQFSGDEEEANWDDV